ncbi:MAG: PQQ-binding-like beta-propeller repeat protein [Verrucomicrobiales bacterium]
MKTPALLFALSALSLFAASNHRVAAADNWPQWRGPDASGASASAKPVIEWGEGKNVLWKIETPGSGNGTPVVWDGKIYFVTAINTGKKPETDAAAEGGDKKEAAARTLPPGVEFVQDPAPEPEPEPRPGGDRRRRGFGGFGDGPLPDFAKRFDKDEDGKLNDEEREAMRASFRGRGGRGGGGRGGFGSQKPTEIHQFVLVCLDASTGKEIWRKVAREELPHEGHHRDHGFASASPVTDGKHMVVSFGSRGIYGFDMKGNKLWEKDLGDMRTRAGFGEGASPALYKGVAVVQWDHEGDSFIVALNAESGDELWRKARPSGTSWSTPLVVEVDGKPQVITSSQASVKAYGLKTGDTIWETDGLTANVIPSPVSDGELVFAMSGFRGSKLRAIKLGGTGKLTEGKGVVWTADEGTPYVPSPLLYDGRLYFFQGNTSALSCLDAKTGKIHYSRERAEGLRGVYASPLGAAGHVYLLDREGNCVVIKAGDTLEVVASNKLDDAFDASPVLIGDNLLLRGKKHLYCIGATKG